MRNTFQVDFLPHLQAGHTNSLANNIFSDGSGFMAFDASVNLFVTDTRNHTIRKITPDGVVTTVAGKAGANTVLGPLANASLKAPRGIAVANEKLLYVVSGNAVLKVTLPGLGGETRGRDPSRKDTSSRWR